MIVNNSGPAGGIDYLAQRKLEAFAQIAADFRASFLFISDVHGQQRFASFPVASSIRYLHALWICECKDRLLSVPTSIERYEGVHCLKLLRNWHEGETAHVAAFLHAKLDAQPFAGLTCQIQEAEQSGNL